MPDWCDRKLGPRMSDHLQGLIKRYGATGAALISAVLVGAAAAAAMLIGCLLFTDMLAGAPETAATAAISAAAAFAMLRPAFSLIEGQIKKERHLEDLVGELRDTQNRLEVSETRFRNIAEAASDWFWEMDADLRFSYFSPRAEEIVGVPIAFHIGKTRAELAGEDINTEKWQHHLDDLENHRPFRDFRFVRRGHDGRLQHLTTSGKPIFDAVGTFQGYIGVGADLTAQIAAEESARLANERLAAAIEGLSELFVLWDPEDRLVVSNERFRRINEPVIETMRPGTLFADHIRAALAKGLYPGAEGREEEWFAERLARHANPTEPFELERQDGQWLLIHEQRFPDGSVATISADITRRKNTELALVRAKETAEEANRSKSDFLARMSHELRTPLNAILGFSQIIRNESFGTIGSPRYREYADDIHASGEMVLSLINDLLDLSKIEAGKFEIRDQVIDLADAVGDVHHMFTDEASAKNLSFETAIEPNPPGLLADPRAFRQALINRVSNALKFTPEAGQVEIQVEVSEGIWISVKDTGIGFPESAVETILAPFGRLDQVETPTVSGTGLGLPIVKSLMELHGGELHIASQPGSGTIATLRFPPSRTVTASSVAAEAD